MKKLFVSALFAMALPAVAAHTSQESPTQQQ